ncbi:MAG: phosphoribosyl-ATP diphosphatase [Alphaproteobacteria bacterium]
MIVPSIDLMGGHAVQLVGGREKALDAGDPRAIAERFRLAGEIAVVDLDAALTRGSNAEVVRELVRLAPCRVGGGIRDAETACAWLDEGAVKIVLGTAAEPDLLRRLPRERVVVALDAAAGEVVVDGWRRRTGRRVAERMKELDGLQGGFLVTFVEREGRMAGVDLARVRELVAAAGDSRLTVAGGIVTADEVAALDRLGADAQVGMALYRGRLDLAEAISAPLTSDRPDGLWPTVVVDEQGKALGLAWSDPKSLREAVRTRHGVYHSRTRGLWVKGATSGAGQDLLRVELDCDRDALRFTVRQHGSGFCHLGTRTCWGDDRGLTVLARRLWARRDSAPPASYTRRLLDDPGLLHAKLLEEATELAGAQAPEDAAHEAADLFYFALVKLVRAGVSLEEVEAELDRRALRVSHRPDEPKAPSRARS